MEVTKCNTYRGLRRKTHNLRQNKIRRNILEQLKQFTFYELYEDILNCLTDTQAGKMANRICAYEFEDTDSTGDMTDEEKFYWENLSEMLCEVKDIEKEDKIPKKYNYNSKHFTFLPLYYRAMKLLNDAKCGIFVKGICRYMLHDELPEFKDKKVEGYFNLCKRQMDMSKQKKKAGSKGGKSKSAERKSEVIPTEEPAEQPSTPQDMSQLTPVEEQSEPTQGMTYEQFRSAHTDIQGALYGASERYITDLDWADVAAKFAADEELNKVRNIYYLARNYEQKYGQTGQAEQTSEVGRF